MRLDIAPTQGRLDELLERIADMLALLRSEEKLLSARDAAALETLTQTKEDLARTINQLSGDLNDDLREQGLPPFPACLETLPRSEASVRQLASTWQKLAALAKQCEQLNETNGAYIVLLRQHVERCLDILHERPAENLTYGPDGVAQRPAASRRLLSI